MRLIDADALIEVLNDNGVPYNADANYFITNAPTIDAVEVARGEWKWISSTYDRTPCRKTYMCSCCRHEVITFDVEPWEHYCPQCGAKMDGERKESE